jgi:hypothetical protein
MSYYFQIGILVLTFSAMIGTLTDTRHIVKKREYRNRLGIGIVVICCLKLIAGYVTQPTKTIEGMDATTAPATTVSAPAVSAPAVSAPAVSAPAVSAPAVSAPAVSAPDATAPAVSAPDATAPAVSAPDATAPAVSAPAVSATTAPATTPATTAPTAAIPTYIPCNCDKYCDVKNQQEEYLKLATKHSSSNIVQESSADSADLVNLPDSKIEQVVSKIVNQTMAMMRQQNNDGVSNPSIQSSLPPPLSAYPDSANSHPYMLERPTDTRQLLFH